MQAVQSDVEMHIEFLLEALKRSTKSNVGAGLVPALYTDRQNWATTRVAPTDPQPLASSALLIGQPQGLPLRERIKWYTIRKFTAAGRCV